MNLRPGSVAWLMQHELRLYWRSGNRKFSSGKTLIFMQALLHLAAVPVAVAAQRTPPLPPNAGAAILTIGGCFVLLMMISRGLVATVQAFFARGDMDLLLSSPLPSRSIVTVRTTSIAVALTIEFALLIWPFTNVFVLFGMLGALKGYILLPAVGFFATSISLVFALLLFDAFGARRTRVISQVMSALVAISFTLIFQLPNMLARSDGGGRTYGSQTLARYAPSAGSELWAPALAILQGAAPTLEIATACALVFWLTTRELSDRFIRASISAAGVGATGHTSSGKGRATQGGLRFSGNTRTIVIRKELRSIARDPWLLSQILQQSLVALPLIVIAWRQHGQGLPLAWGSLIVVTGNLGSALAWLTVTAEDAPELLAASPIARGYFVRAKLAAALLPVVPIALLPLAFLARSHTWFGLSVSLCALGSALTCASLNVSDRSTAKRQEFRRRMRNDPGRSFLELGAVGVWVGVCALMVWLSPWR